MIDRRATPGAAAGFTLLEMLVALAVMAIAALTLLRVDGFALRGAADLDQRAVAALVVHNQAVILWTDPRPPAIGSSQISATNAGQQWQIDQRVQRTDDAALIQIDLTARPAGGTGAAAALTIIRPAS